ncbi:hypothetical protein SC206_19140 [Rouxiella sp. T17]|uniref:hypothetical protein n=1 Tax=Rouxiella sp. T17 TaxID=3085684 RepID=UPI002FC66EFA
MTALYKESTVLGLLILVCIFGGWKAHTIWDGYKSTKALEAATIVAEQNDKIQATIAKQFEDQKIVLEQNKNTVTHEVQTIVKQPIYQTVCIDQTAIDVLQKYKDESNKLRDMGND